MQEKQYQCLVYENGTKDPQNETKTFYFGPMKIHCDVISGTFRVHITSGLVEVETPIGTVLMPFHEKLNYSY